MRKAVLALCAIMLLFTGCYHITVSTGAAEAPTQIDRPWQLSFVEGLVPPPEVNTEAECPNGVAKVETERSFLNALVGALTWGILTPMHVKVTCAR